MNCFVCGMEISKKDCKEIKINGIIYTVCSDYCAGEIHNTLNEEEYTQ